MRAHYNKLKITSRGNRIKLIGEETIVNDAINKIEHIQRHILEFGSITDSMMINYLIIMIKFTQWTKRKTNHCSWAKWFNSLSNPNQKNLFHLVKRMI